MKRKTALIVGATGLIGRFCLNELLENEQYNKVVSIGRNSLDLNHRKLKQISVNFDQFVSVPEIKKLDDVFCCLGTTIKKAGSKNEFRKVDYEYPLALAKMAIKAGASQYMIVTSIGANKNSPVFYTKTKGEVEHELMLSGFSRLKIFRPSILVGNRQEKRTGEELALGASKLMPFLYWGPFSSYKPIQAIDVARVMVNEANCNTTSDVLIYESRQIQEIANRLK